MKFKINHFVFSLLFCSFSAQAQAQAQEQEEVLRAILVDPAELDENKAAEEPTVFVEVIKVKVNGSGKVTDSILDVRGADDKPKEFVLVTVNGQLQHAWVTSTAKSYARRKHATRGWIYPHTAEGKNFHPHTLSQYHESSAYNGGKMPFAIFFNGGIALHSTTTDHYRELGDKDSGACSRLYRPNAMKLWNYVNPYGVSYIDSDSVRLDLIEKIKSRVTVNVYGFDNEERTTADDRARLKEKYAYAKDWIQSSVRKDIADIQASLKPAAKKKKR